MARSGRNSLPPTSLRIPIQTHTQTELWELLLGCSRPRSVDDADVREVLLYRAGLVMAAASVMVATSGAFLPEGHAVGNAVRQGADLFYAAEAGGLTPPSTCSSPSRISAP